MENTKVDFKYSFGAPHRLCISLPQASKKCLLDSSPDGVTVLWSDDDLTKIAPGAFYGPKIQWIFDINIKNFFDTKLMKIVVYFKIIFFDILFMYAVQCQLTIKFFNFKNLIIYNHI